MAEPVGKCYFQRDFQIMRLGFYNFYKQYNRNRMFEDPSSPIGDNLMYPFVHLGHKLRALGHEVTTLDLGDLSRFEAVVFLDHPTFLNPYFRRLQQLPGVRRYLFLLENPANRPDNYWPANHRAFERVFTWNPQLVDERKYHRFYLPNQIPAVTDLPGGAARKFCVSIASQKYSNHPDELYSERVRAIRFFERQHPAEFDLYGTLWDRWYFRGRLARLNLFLQKLYAGPLRSWHTRRFPSWRGPVPGKHAVLRQYRFAICYENAVFPGYITEKLFDCLFAGCVPVYRGAPEVVDVVPAGTFIDQRNFRNYDELYQYLKTMPVSEYENYRTAITAYLAGPTIQKFGPDAFTQLILDHIVSPRTPG